MSNQNPVILAVDDDPFNLDIIDEFLSGAGFELLTADCGEKALDILHFGKTKVDVVLLDRMMPDMDGLEALRIIKQNPELAMIPVILLTAAGESAQVAEGVSAGCFYYLTKPFDRTVLHTALSAALSEQIGQKNSAATTDLPTPQLSPQDAHPDLPGLAVARGLVIWKKATVYRQYLRKFALNYADCVLEMAQSEHAVAASTAHKLKGSSGNLALTEVAAIATELDHALRNGKCPADCYIRLQSALDTAFESIARYDAAEITQDNVVPVHFEIEKVIPLLDRLIKAFNTDSPAEIEPVVAELGKFMPSLRLKPIRMAIENFDFRGGAAATRSIAVELGI
jgi:CheY-like chemotaxis protein